MNCCKDCPDRWVDTAAGTTCHSVCARYAAMRAEKDKQYAERLTWRARRTLRQSGGREQKDDRRTSTVGAAALKNTQQKGNPEKLS